MASPIIKIKTGTQKPAGYTYNPSTKIQTGLTTGELGLLIDATNQKYAFYIGNQTGEAITFGCEVSTDVTLGGTTPSNSKIPTQSAIKGYVASLGQPTPSSVSVISRYYNSTSDGAININSNAVGVVKFGLEDFATSGGIAGFAYNTANGLFTATAAMNLLITYQITWAGLAAATTYNSLNAIRTAWIQKAPGQSTLLTQNRYGFNTIILPPQAIASSGSITGTQNGSAIISLAANETFNIQCKNHGANQHSIAETSIWNDGFGQQQNMLKATNIQIARV